jgi:hypothetical protein
MAFRFLESGGAREQSPQGRLAFRSAAGERAAGPPSFADVLRTTAEELIDLLTAQLKLARAELSADITKGMHRMVRVAMFVPALVCGYAFAMAGYM